MEIVRLLLRVKSLSFTAQALKLWQPYIEQKFQNLIVDESELNDDEPKLSFPLTSPICGLKSIVRYLIYSQEKLNDLQFVVLNDLLAQFRLNGPLSHILTILQHNLEINAFRKNSFLLSRDLSILDLLYWSGLFLDRSARKFLESNTSSSISILQGQFAIVRRWYELVKGLVNTSHQVNISKLFDDDISVAVPSNESAQTTKNPPFLGSKSNVAKEKENPFSRLAVRFPPMSRELAKKLLSKLISSISITVSEPDKNLLIENLESGKLTLSDIKILFIFQQGNPFGSVFFCQTFDPTKFENNWFHRTQLRSSEQIMLSFIDFFPSKWSNCALHKLWQASVFAFCDEQVIFTTSISSFPNQYESNFNSFDHPALWFRLNFIANMAVACGHQGKNSLDSIALICLTYCSHAFKRSNQEISIHIIQIIIQQDLSIALPVIRCFTSIVDSHRLRDIAALLYLYSNENHSLNTLKEVSKNASEKYRKLLDRKIVSQGGSTGHCLLCMKDAPIDSHVIPDFVYSYLKNISRTGMIVHEPPRTRRLLCHNHDSILFNGHEEYFSTHVFKPRHDNTFQTDNKLDWNRIKYFVCSIFWRILTLFDKYDRFGEDYERCRRELLKHSSTSAHGFTEPFPIHLFFVEDRIHNSGISYSIEKNENIIWCKLPGFMLIGCLKNCKLKFGPFHHLPNAILHHYVKSLLSKIEISCITFIESLPSETKNSIQQRLIKGKIPSNKQIKNGFTMDKINDYWKNMDSTTLLEGQLGSNSFDILSEYITMSASGVVVSFTSWDPKMCGGVSFVDEVDNSQTSILVVVWKDYKYLLMISQTPFKISFGLRYPDFSALILNPNTPLPPENQILFLFHLFWDRLTESQKKALGLD